MATRPAPYHFVPVRPDLAIADSPVPHHVQHLGDDWWSGELRCSMTVLTPTLAANDQYEYRDMEEDLKAKLDTLASDRGCRQGIAGDKKILEPLALPRDDGGSGEPGPVLIPGSQFTGLLRHSLGALLSAPMERVQERTFSYRVNQDVDGREDKLSIRPAVVLGHANREGKLPVLLMAPEDCVYVLRPYGQPREEDTPFETRILRGAGYAARLDLPACSPGTQPPAFLKKLLKQNEIGELTNVRLSRPRGRSYVKEDESARDADLTEYVLLPYHYGADGDGVLFDEFRQQNEREGEYAATKYVLVGIRGLPWGHTWVDEACVANYDQTLIHLADMAAGHLMDHPLFTGDKRAGLANVSARILALKDTWRKPGSLVYCEVDREDRIVTIGHHFRYRWRYRDTVHLASGELRPVLKPTTGETTKPEREAEWPDELTGARLLFGYVGAPNPWLLREGDIRDWPILRSKWLNLGRQEQLSEHKRVWDLLPPDVKAMAEMAESNGLDGLPGRRVVDALNGVLSNPDFFKDGYFEGVAVPEPALCSRMHELADVCVQRVNRRLLEACYPKEIARTLGYSPTDPLTQGIGRGDTEQLAGRLAFNMGVERLRRDHTRSDGQPRFVGNGDDGWLVPLRPLGSPKPSAVEHYLTQDRLPQRRDAGILCTYGDTPDDATAGELRGRKFYLHATQAATNARFYELVDAKCRDWQPGNTTMVASNMAGVGRFISAAGSEFGFTLRFTNLRTWELGAVLLALSPSPKLLLSLADGLGEHGNALRAWIDRTIPADANTPPFAQKLGHGRPLGLGSVHMDVKGLWRLVRDANRVASLKPHNGWSESVTAFGALARERLGESTSDWVANVLTPWLNVHRYAGRDQNLSEHDYPRGSDGTIFGYHTRLRQDHTKGRKMNGPAPATVSGLAPLG